MNPILHQQALHYLRQALGDPTAQFHEGQYEAIEALVQDRAQQLVVQRTGWGKSIVYFLATRLLRERGEGPALLISPLLALMRNQQAMARRLGVLAVTINSTNDAEWGAIERRLSRDEVDILLISPERLANDLFMRDILAKIAARISLFVVDEAHCISDWGHDFRPDYRRIVRILQAMPPHMPVLATTATANARVVGDIVSQLGDKLRVVRGSLARTSLRLQNIALASQGERLAWLAEHLPRMPGSGIIYTLTQRDAERVAAWLRSRGIDAHPYHADLENTYREQVEQALLSNSLKAVVATTALGMGFDKPDLGFVVHFQRPGSVVHYYQQVGRAGRALSDAYGILFNGDEDQDILTYFVEQAFPPEGHVEQVLAALEAAEQGVSLYGLEELLNLRRGQIEKVLKLLVVESPSPVAKEGSRWYATAIPYHPNREKVDRLIAIRQEEQAEMTTYMSTRDCLMAFLQRTLDDPTPQRCGRCANCVGQPLLPTHTSPALANEAAHFLNRLEQPIEPRKQWPSGLKLATYGWKGRLPDELLMQEGRVLSMWGDAGWGELVREGKYRDGYFSDELVVGVVEMILERWQPQPFPTWITCVPSLNRPELVLGFATRLATRLNLPFIAAVKKVRVTEPQKKMSNSYQQCKNLDGAFSVEHIPPFAPVFLVDDTVDSRWTLTLIAALLRRAGSGPVFPLALAMAATR